MLKSMECSSFNHYCHCFDLYRFRLKMECNWPVNMQYSDNDYRRFCLMILIQAHGWADYKRRFVVKQLAISRSCCWNTIKVMNTIWKRFLNANCLVWFGWKWSKRWTRTFCLKLRKLKFNCQIQIVFALQLEIKLFTLVNMQGFISP